MAIVVTGASGFIGRAVVSRLLADGERVVAVDRRPSPTQPHPALAVLQADLTTDTLARGVLADADAVIHLAGCPGVRDTAADVAWRRHRDNVLATAAVLDAVQPDTPVVVASSSSVYGGSSGRPSAETDPLRPLGGYARSKATAEALCAHALARGGVVATARPFTVVGEHQRPDMALAKWLADARAGRPLRVLGGLDRTRDLTDVRDVARALVALARRGARGPVNVGTGRAVTLREMVDAVGAACGIDVEVVVTAAAALEPAATLADTRRLVALTGVAPWTDLADVTARLVAAAEPLPERLAS